jgi:transcriptional regulator with XRE-family HTH domain
MTGLRGLNLPGRLSAWDADRNGYHYPRIMRPTHSKETPSVHQQLGEFLRKRREGSNPRDFGIATHDRRRTPGLRREEVAELSGISVDWYVRLEQGSESLPSKTTIEKLANALHFSAMERAHILHLALGNTGRVFRRETVPPHLVTLIHGLSTAAYVVGARRDLLCWNKAATDLFRDFAKVSVERRNTLLQMFISPDVRSRYPAWEDEARSALEDFRLTYDFWSHSPPFNALVDELRTQSPEFADWWKSHHVHPKPSGTKVMLHPRYGRIKVLYSTFQSNDNPDLRVILYGGITGRNGS